MLSLQLFTNLFLDNFIPNVHPYIFEYICSFAVDELNSADITLLPILTRFLLEAVGEFKREEEQVCCYVFVYFRCCQ